MKTKQSGPFVPASLRCALFVLLLGFARPGAHADGVVQQWVARYSGPGLGNENAHAVAADSSGNVFMTGSSYGETSIYDFYTAKYAAGDGALLWEKRYNGPANKTDEAAAMALDSSGNVIVTGYSNVGNGYSDIYTAKYAGMDGALLWEKRYDGPAKKTDIAAAVVVDGDGNVIVAGSSSGTTNMDAYTAKYAAADGTLLWEKRYNGPDNGHDGLNAVTVDGGGNIIVAGYSDNSSGTPDYYTAKYAAADGALLWENRYDGPSDGTDRATAVAVDGDGNVVVTGNSFGTGKHLGSYTVKYAATNGTLIWEQRHNLLITDGAYEYSVMLDTGGNAIITGKGDGNGIYTAKYAATNGAILWERAYIEPGGAADAYRVAVDDQGNATVVGYARYANGKTDAYTAKYAAADGALLWEKRYNGPSNNTDMGLRLALTPDGGAVIAGTSVGGAYTDSVTLKYMPVETTTLAATDIGSTFAVFHGTANPGGVTTSVSYEWGATPALGNTTFEQSIGASTNSVSVKVSVRELPAGATIYFRIRADSSQGTNYGAILSFSTLTSLQGWKLAHLGDANAPDLGDPDGDGLSTLAEYGLAFLPEIPNTAPAVTLYDDPKAGRRLRMFVQRDPAHNDVTVEVQSAGDVAGPWTTVAASVLGAPFAGPGYVSGDGVTPGVKTVVVRDTVNFADVGRRFMRVRVTH